MAVTVLDDEEGDPGKGKAKFRVFNTSSAAPDQVDVYLITAACSTLDSSAAAPTATGVSGLQTAYSRARVVGTAYHLCVTGAGDKSDLRLEIPSFVLSEKRIVTVILARGAGGYLLNAIVLDQQGAATQALNASARVRAATSVPGTVDVAVNGTAIAAGLASPNVGPYTLVPAGPISVQVNGADVAPVAPLTAAPGADVTVLLTGSTPTRDAAVRRQHAFVEHRTAGEAAPRQRAQRHDRAGDADAQQRAGRHLDASGDGLGLHAGGLERRPGPPRGEGRHVCSSTSTPPRRSNRAASIRSSCSATARWRRTSAS